MNIYQMNLVVDVFGQGQSGCLSGQSGCLSGQSRTPIGTVGMPLGTVEDASRDSRGRLSGQSRTPIGTVEDACPYNYEWRIGRRSICWGDS